MLVEPPGAVVPARAGLTIAAIDRLPAGGRRRGAGARGRVRWRRAGARRPPRPRGLAAAGHRCRGAGARRGVLALGVDLPRSRRRCPGRARSRGPGRSQSVGGGRVAGRRRRPPRRRLAALPRETGVAPLVRSWPPRVGPRSRSWSPVRRRAATCGSGWSPRSIGTALAVGVARRARQGGPPARGAGRRCRRSPAWARCSSSVPTHPPGPAPSTGPPLGPVPSRRWRSGCSRPSAAERPPRWASATPDAYARPGPTGPLRSLSPPLPHDRTPSPRQEASRRQEGTGPIRRATPPGRRGDQAAQRLLALAARAVPGRAGHGRRHGRPDLHRLQHRPAAGRAADPDVVRLRGGRDGGLWARQRHRHLQRRGGSDQRPARRAPRRARAGRARHRGPGLLRARWRRPRRHRPRALPGPARLRQPARAVPRSPSST